MYLSICSRRALLVIRNFWSGFVQIYVCFELLGWFNFHMIDSWTMIARDLWFQWNGVLSDIDFFLSFESKCLILTSKTSEKHLKLLISFDEKNLNKSSYFSFINDQSHPIDLKYQSYQKSLCTVQNFH